jgi:putative pre-16S rRNA nuclease
MTRLIGLDLGERRIGVAVSDPTGVTAQPLDVIDRTSPERDVERIVHLTKEYEGAEVVVGLPLKLNGTRGDAAAKAEEFAAGLEEIGLSVHLWDERLTTVQAERTLRSGGVGGRKRRRVIDKVAAAVMLQAYLDSSR